MAFDLYQRVVSDGDQLASGLAQLIRSTGAKRVLDCAAGSGLPALQLHQQGLDVTCSDGDLTMVKRFQYNARLLGVSDECHLVDWDDLDPDDGLYDYVMCRGDSLAYAKSWGGGSGVADVDYLSRYLEKFASVMKPDGLQAPALACPQGVAETGSLSVNFSAPDGRAQFDNDIVGGVDA